MLEAKTPGAGINGILYAAPISDLAAVAVILGLTIPFFRSLGREEAVVPADQRIIKPSRPGTIITIAREHGTAGKQLGALVAQRLGVPFYYKEMTALAAQESGLASGFISSLNEEGPGVLYDLYLSTDVVHRAVIAQEEIIRKIADHGACVIVGRAADHVLRHYDNVVRVFLHAPKEYRVAKIMEMYGDDKEAALRNIRHSDNARAGYYRNISGQNWGDPHNYDLCLDVSMGTEACLDIICRAVENKG